jgi:hypothetical protein
MTLLTHSNSLLSVTLAGPTLLLTLITLIVSIHLLKPTLTATILALAPLPCIVHNDYRAFISLGPGGTPSTFLGYLKITYLRLFALSDPYSPPPILGSICPSTGCFQTCTACMPSRRGRRPTVAGIAPQRQRDQVGDYAIYLALRQALHNTAAKYPTKLKTDVSCFEKQGLALFAISPLNNTCRGEICHVHHTDHSFHMNLHPLDAKVVLQAGWGQRHPLAQGGWLKKYVPQEFMMVYAPRNEDELEVILKIIEAAAWWVMGERIEMEIPPRESITTAVRVA